MVSKVVVTGASGFIGHSLIESLLEYKVVALYRSTLPSLKHGNLEWRSCDLFSLKQTIKSLEGADTAIYLVHSMMPSARLFQGEFQDVDLLIADNFIRAAQLAGVKRIIYMGGLEQNHETSQHLKSRYEVEKVLSSSGIQLTTLRAGIVIGRDGSSFRILERLVKRLPVMFCPKWVHTETEPIALADVLRAVHYCLERDEKKDVVYDLGCNQSLTYRDLMLKVAKAFGLKRCLVPVPVLSPRISAFWVALITGISIHLIKPLIESLKTPMLARDSHRIPILKLNATTVDDAIRDATQLHENESLRPKRKFLSFFKRASEVRSIHRLPWPQGQNAEWLSKEYMRWLTGFMRPFILVEEIEKDVHVFRVAWTAIVLLKFHYRKEFSHNGRYLFQIVGGLLARVPKSENPLHLPRLEFREVASSNCLLACIHNFQPRLPWYIYKYTQAPFHMWVMKQFEMHLKKM